MNSIHDIIGNFYGLDWAVLLFGVTSSLLMTNGRLHHGMRFSLAACTCGLIVAYLSGQHGFVVYNILLISINLRGILRGDRRGLNREARVANNNSMPQAVPARAHAR